MCLEQAFNSFLLCKVEKTVKNADVHQPVGLNDEHGVLAYSEPLDPFHLNEKINSIQRC